mmetsp:Transcript_26941/g.48466  ORF Transcript_26941/g.48466 Transcript_26941/m.48466 type:complete len:216 (-) Transcript_26941:89-736(-)
MFFISPSLVLGAKPNSLGGGESMHASEPEIITSPKKKRSRHPMVRQDISRNLNGLLYASLWNTRSEIGHAAMTSGCPNVASIVGKTAGLCLCVYVTLQARRVQVVYAGLCGTFAPPNLLRGHLKNKSYAYILCTHLLHRVSRVPAGLGVFGRKPRTIAGPGIRLTTAPVKFFPLGDSPGPPCLRSVYAVCLCGMFARGVRERLRAGCPGVARPAL